MRLEKYITENKTDVLMKVIKRDCKQYINEIKKYNKNDRRLWFRRGIDPGFTDDILIKKRSHIKDGRSPRAANIIIHNLFNIKSEEIFGWPIRNGVSTASTAGHRVFGEMRIFLPIGDYEYVWSPNIRDFNDHVVRNDIMKMIPPYLNELFDKMLFDSFFDVDDIQVYINQYYPNTSVKNVLEDLGNAIEQYIRYEYRNNNMKAALESKNEVTFKCDRYYIVNDEDLFLEIMEMEY